MRRPVLFLILGNLGHWFTDRWGIIFNIDVGNDSTTNGIDYKVDMTQAGPTFGWAFTF